jgi:hypothetical protein
VLSIPRLAGFGRFAPVQLLFWGNPITSGNPSVDFFMSADVMEAPLRTTMHPEVGQSTRQTGSYAVCLHSHGGPGLLLRM